MEAADVELIVEDGSNFRILENRNLTVRGPFVMDADPLGWTQGEIVDFNEEDMTIDAQLFEGYAMPTKGERIEIFTPDGVMLPHGQDCVQVQYLSAAIFALWISIIHDDMVWRDKEHPLVLNYPKQHL